MLIRDPGRERESSHTWPPQCLPVALALVLAAPAEGRGVVELLPSVFQSEHLQRSADSACEGTQQEILSMLENQSCNLDIQWNPIKMDTLKSGHL